MIKKKQKIMDSESGDYNMSTLKKIVRDIKKYKSYMLFAAKCDLKSEVSGSYLNWMWWILDPLLYMVVYTFISVIVFRTTEKYFQIFIIMGVIIWNFFNKIIVTSVHTVKNNAPIISKVYVPKYIFLIEKILVNLFKLSVSFILIFIMMALWKVPFNFRIFLAVPYIILLVTASFAIGTILLHFGVYISDLSNIVTVFLRLVFYMSGIFYSIENRVPAPFNNIILVSNPSAFVINNVRNLMLYNGEFKIVQFSVWMIVSIIMSYIGIRIIYKYERNYTKVS